MGVSESGYGVLRRAPKPDVELAWIVWNRALLCVAAHTVDHGGGSRATAVPPSTPDAGGPRDGPCHRVARVRTALAKDRGDVDCERFTSRALVGFTPQMHHTASASTRIDCDDLQSVETAMQKEPMFRHPWVQFRKTLILEHVPWFVEPRIFSTRRAEEIFTQDTLLSHRVNLAFYSQLPSLVTGIGLLLTFLALFIGLSRLHADGREIVGIQRLINGLAGKFLTSIVGLFVATPFTLLVDTI